MKKLLFASFIMFGLVNLASAQKKVRSKAFSVSKETPAKESQTAKNERIVAAKTAAKLQSGETPGNAMKVRKVAIKSKNR